MSDNYYYIVMKKLGESLEAMRVRYDGKIRLEVAAALGCQIVDRLQVLHSHGIVHRDIKPENFLKGVAGDAGTVNLIDFGLSSVFMDANDEHIPFRGKRGLIGTAKFTSHNSHQGFEQSRRDDMESMWYMLVYLINGKLPWENPVGDTVKERTTYIYEMKSHLPTPEMYGILPEEYIEIFGLIRGLEFESPPDYLAIKSLMWEGVGNEYPRKSSADLKSRFSKKRN